MPFVQASINIQRPGIERTVQFQFDNTKFGQQIMLDAFSKQQMYEQETARVLDLILQPGDTFLDIGGHIGFFSMVAAAMVGPAGRVFTFEPDPSNYQHLLHHIAINDYHNVFPCHWAVGQTSGVVEFFFNPDNDGGHALWDPGKHPFNEKARANVVKRPVFLTALDDFFRGAQPGFVKLIKIDTEGNEVNVLRGAKQFLVSAQVPAVIAEFNQFGLEQMNSSEAELRSLMAELGYTTYALVGNLPVRLQPGQSIQSQVIYNFLFVNAALQALAAPLWPQDVTAVAPPPAEQPAPPAV